MELMARSDHKAWRVLQVRTALTARSDRKVQRDPWVQLERTEPMARRDRKVRRDRQVQLERMELTARQDRKARRDPRV